MSSLTFPATISRLPSQIEITLTILLEMKTLTTASFMLSLYMLFN